MLEFRIPVSAYFYLHTVKFSIKTFIQERIID